MDINQQVPSSIGSSQCVSRAGKSKERPFTPRPRPAKANTRIWSQTAREKATKETQGVPELGKALPAIAVVAVVVAVAATRGGLDGLRRRLAAERGLGEALLLVARAAALVTGVVRFPGPLGGLLARRVGGRGVRAGHGDEVESRAYEMRRARIRGGLVHGRARCLEGQTDQMRDADQGMPISSPWASLAGAGAGLVDNSSSGDKRISPRMHADILRVGGGVGQVGDRWEGEGEVVMAMGEPWSPRWDGQDGGGDGYVILYTLLEPRTEGPGKISAGCSSSPQIPTVTVASSPSDAVRS